MKKLIILLILTTISVQQYAQKWDRQMRLNKCDISIVTNEFTATTFVEMEFCNDATTELEGMYRFQLKPYQVITAFQLDLNGTYRDGSIEEKWKANNTYNSIVGKRIDPAILQMDYIGNYTLRIYPVPAGGCRKVTFTILQKLKEQNNLLHYSLPVFNIGEVKNFTVKVKTPKNPIEIKTGILKGTNFTNNELIYSTTLASKYDSIYFAIPMEKEIVCINKVDSINYFALRYIPQQLNESFINPKNIAVFWDVSTSNKYDDNNLKIDFLKKYIDTYNINTITITTFNYKIKTQNTWNTNNWNAIETFLKNVQYGGATQMGCINLNVPTADAILLYSDGINSYGKAMPTTGKEPIFALVQNKNNNSALQKIIGLSGGAIIEIIEGNMSNAIEKANIAKENLLQITSNNKTLQLDQEIDTFLQTQTVLSGNYIGDVDAIMLHYGNKKTNSRKIININKSNICNSSINRLEMLDRFENLQPYYNWDYQLLFGREEKIITQQTAYLVLERIEDYIKYNITPPKDIEHIVKANPLYVATPKQNPILFNAAQTEIEQLKKVVAIYNNRIKEWDKTTALINVNEIKTMQRVKLDNIDVIKNDYKQLASNNQNFGEDRSMMLSESVVVTGYSAAKRKSLTTSSVSYLYSNELGNNTNLAQALQGRIAGLQVVQNAGLYGNTATIQIRGISSLSGNNKPLYVIDGVPVNEDFALNTINVNDIQDVTVLKDAQASILYGSRASNGVIIINSKKGKFYYRNTFENYKLKNEENVEYIDEIKDIDYKYRFAKYLELQQKYYADKSFYFDMAQLFIEWGDSTIAKEIITNAAELNMDNQNTLQAIAFCYDKWGMYTDAQEIYVALIEQYPNNINYYSNLALNYQLNKQYQNALDIYYKGLLINVYAPEQKAFILNEMNALIAMQQDKLNIENIPTSIIKALPVDMRIVVESNSYNTHIATVTTKNEQLNKGLIYYDYNSYNYNKQVQEFLYKNTNEKKYRISLRYYGSTIKPDMYRVIVYKNFGKPNQTIEIENYVLDNQYGNVTIHEIKK